MFTCGPTLFLADIISLMQTGVGWFGGGYVNTNNPVIDGINFNTEVQETTSAVLSVPRTAIAGVNSTTRGYFTGGNTTLSTATAEIDGIQFSDRTAINPTAALGTASYYPTGINSYTKGYTAGGYNPTAGGYLSHIQGLTFTTETVANAAVSMSNARLGSCGVNSSTTGFIAGGSSGVLETLIDGMIYATETLDAVSATLSLARYFKAGVNSTTTGYFGGGANLGGTLTHYSEIDGILFSSKTSVNPSATLSVARGNHGGVNSAVRGYFGGGYVGGAFGGSAEIDGIQFSDSTAVNPSATLTVARHGIAGVNPNLLYEVATYSGRGYWAGGLNGPYLSVIDGIAFATQTGVYPSASLSQPRYLTAGVSSTTKGYITGGADGVSSQLTTTDGIRFIDEAAINPAASLLHARVRGTGVNALHKGYIAGGSFNTNTVEAYEYDTETTAMTAGSLSAMRAAMGGVSSPTRGYWGGGSAGSLVNTIDSFVFDSEIMSLLSATLVTARDSLFNAGTRSHGYFAGGRTGSTTPVSEIDGIAFPSDTAINPSTALVVARYFGGSVQSDTHGFFAAGYGSGGNKSEVDGISFFTLSSFNVYESLTQVNPSFAVQTRVGATGVYPNTQLGPVTAHRGYAPAGGNTSDLHLRVLDFTTETWSVLLSTMSAYHNYATGFQSGANGYVASGSMPSGQFGYTNTIDSMEFSTESCKLLTATISRYLRWAAGINSQDAGYICGGINDNPFSTAGYVDKLAFSTHTTTALGIVLSRGMSQQAGAACSSTKGYLAGGHWPETNQIEGFTYATEVGANLSATLSIARDFLSGFNSTTHGYFAGGDNSSGVSVDEIDGIVFATEAATNPSAALSQAVDPTGSVNSTSKGYVLYNTGLGGIGFAIDSFDFGNETVSSISVTVGNVGADSPFQSGSL